MYRDFYSLKVQDKVIIMLKITIILICYVTKNNQMAQILNPTGTSTINHEIMVEIWKYGEIRLKIYSRSVNR